MPFLGVFLKIFKKIIFCSILALFLKLWISPHFLWKATQQYQNQHNSIFFAPKWLPNGLFQSLLPGHCTRRKKWHIQKLKWLSQHLKLDKWKIAESKLAYFWVFFCGFPIFWGISLNFLPKCHTCLESSCNEDSNATFPKSLGCTSKCTDFCDGHGTELWSITESLS